jgi:hypothetical protein
MIPLRLGLRLGLGLRLWLWFWFRVDGAFFIVLTIDACAASVVHCLLEFDGADLLASFLSPHTLCWAIVCDSVAWAHLRFWLRLWFGLRLRLSLGLRFRLTFGLRFRLTFMLWLRLWLWFGFSWPGVPTRPHYIIVESLLRLWCQF